MIPMYRRPLFCVRDKMADMKIVIVATVVLTGLLKITSSSPNTEIHPKIAPSKEARKWKRADSNATSSKNDNNRADTALAVLGQALLKDEPMVAEEVGSCSRCLLFGLSTVRRVGRCSVVETERQSQRVKVNLAFPYFNATCNCTFSMASGVLHATIEKFVLYLDVEVDFNSTDETDVKEVTVKSPGKMALTFEQTGVLGWIYQAVLGIFRPLIMNKFRAMLIEEVPKLVHNNKEQLQHLGWI